MQNQPLDSVLYAIGNSTRRAILDRLTKGPSRVTDLAAPFEMSLNAVSKHIKVLEEAGLVHRTLQGREHTLELDPTPLREVVRWASQYEQFWTEQLDRLENHFKKGKS
ncbi:MAG: metalloregulator ArsR/SmtB family transcription factor [Kofleriaceae bacterium]